MERNLALEFVRVTEGAAIAAAKWVGKGDKMAADKAATEAMRSRFNSIDFDGKIVIGEGERDEAPMLFIGEEVGNKKGPRIDIAVDPLEGTNICAVGGNNSMSVMAAGPEGSLLHAPDTYMDKIAVGSEVEGVDLDKSIKENIEAVSRSLGKEIEDVTVIMLERERHKQLIEQVRKVGARLQLIGDGDIAGAIAPALNDSRVDILLGIGAAPEGVIAAAALKCLDGKMQGRLAFRNEEEKIRAKKMGLQDLNKKFDKDDLAIGDRVQFVATGVTDGTILDGVNFTRNGARTSSMVMRSYSKTIRKIETLHHFKSNKPCRTGVLDTK
jgi:fructose-1,6-bisphosphatase class II